MAQRTRTAFSQLRPGSTSALRPFLLPALSCSTNPMATILLLTFSNVFMTVAWYGHLKYGHNWPRESDSGFMDDRARRLLAGGAGKSSRLWRVLRLPAQDHSRGGDAGRVHRIRGHVPQGESRLELSGSVRLS